MSQVQAEVEASGARAEGTESESDEDDAEGGRDERGSEKIIAMIMEDHDGGSDDDDPGGDGGAEQSASTPRSLGSGGRESGASRSSYVQKYYWTHSGESLAPPWPLELSKTPRRRLTERFPCSNDLARVSLCPFC